jgi:septal ring factor EnvC (AmiA/AmiB activator)
VHATADNTKNDLKQVQKQLIDTNKTFKQQRKQFNQLENDIKRADTQIAQSSKKLKKLKFDIELSYTEQATLKEQINQLEQDKSNQQTALSAQLKSAYTTGSHDYTKLLLNQDKVKNV